MLLDGRWPSEFVLFVEEREREKKGIKGPKGFIHSLLEIHSGGRIEKNTSTEHNQVKGQRKEKKRVHLDIL
jgi:hypothetical protein